MDLVFGSLEILKSFFESLIYLDLSRTEANQLEILSNFCYHLYNVHKSNKCIFANFLFPNSKKMYDELLLQCMECDDEKIVDFVSKLLQKIDNEPYDSNLDATEISNKYFIELNKYATIQQQIEDSENKSEYLSTEDLLACSNIDKQSILYKCINKEVRRKYFKKKKLLPPHKLDEIIKELDIKCSKEIFEKVTKKKKHKPLIYALLRKNGDTILKAFSFQKDKMNFCVMFIQKLYL